MISRVMSNTFKFHIELSMTRFIILAAALAVAAAPVPKTDPLPPITEKLWNDSADNLKQLAVAIHAYHDVNGHFPQNLTDGKGTPLLSWRVQLLPFLDADDLFKQFKQTEAWDSEHNKKLLEKMPKAFAPVRVKGALGETYYQGFVGRDTFFRTEKPIAFNSISDGCSNTAMLVEAEKSVPWTKPIDLSFDAAKDLPKLGGFFDGAFNMLMADGSVMRVKKGFNPVVMKLAIQIADGSVIDVESLRK